MLNNDEMEKREKINKMINDFHYDSIHKFYGFLLGLDLKTHSLEERIEKLENYNTMKEEK